MSTTECNFVLNDTINCICKCSQHNMFTFGHYRPKDEFIYFDDVNFVYDDNPLFELAHNHYYMLKNKEYPNNYINNCNCNYCLYVKNKQNNIYETCFCCKSRLYIKDDFINNYIHCSECNSILCCNCYIQGLYKDTTYCYDCRKFAIHKNSKYYFNYDENPNDEWDFASYNY